MQAGVRPPRAPPRPETRGPGAAEDEYARRDHHAAPTGERAEAAMLDGKEQEHAVDVTEPIRVPAPEPPLLTDPHCGQRERAGDADLAVVDDGMVPAPREHRLPTLGR